MATVLNVVVSDCNFDGEDNINCSCFVSVQDSEGDVAYAPGFSIPLKALGLYKTPLQLAQNLLTEAQEFIEGQGHTETPLRRYLYGGPNTAV